MASTAKAITISSRRLDSAKEAFAVSLHVAKPLECGIEAACFRNRQHERSDACSNVRERRPCASLRPKEEGDTWLKQVELPRRIRCSARCVSFRDAELERAGEGGAVIGWLTLRNHGRCAREVLDSHVHIPTRTVLYS